MVGNKAWAISAPGQADPPPVPGCLPPQPLQHILPSPHRPSALRDLAGGTAIVPADCPRGGLPRSPGAEAQIN